MGGILEGFVQNSDAKTHLDENEFLFTVAGKTLYIPFSDEGGQNIATWEFSADGTKLTVTEESTFTESISFDGNIISIDNNDGTFTTITALEISVGGEFILFNFVDVASNEDWDATMYFDRADAEATFTATTTGSFI